MTYIVGIAYTHYGPKGMLSTEAVFGIAAVIFFVILQKIMYRKSAFVAPSQ